MPPIADGLPTRKPSETRKSGRSTLVVYESLKQYAANLPVAKFRAQPAPRQKA
jgi:hypothetical protein